MQENKWARLLAYVTGLVNQRLLLQNEYLIAKNRVLRAHLPARMRLSDPERSTLAEIGKRLGRAALPEGAGVAKPETPLPGGRRLIAANSTALIIIRNGGMTRSSSSSISQITLGR